MTEDYVIVFYCPSCKAIRVARAENVIVWGSERTFDHCLIVRCSKCGQEAKLKAKQLG